MNQVSNIHCRLSAGPGVATQKIRHVFVSLLMAASVWQSPTVLAASPAPQASSPAAVTPAATPTTPAPAKPFINSLVKLEDGRSVAPDIARIVNKGELVIAMLGVDTPPFFSGTGDNLHGLEVELARLIGQELKVPVRFDRSAKSFNEVVDVVARGQADLGISKLSRTLARAQLISFSEPYLRLKHAFLLNRVRFAEYARDVPLPTAIRNYKGTLGVIANSSFAYYAQRYFPKADLKRYPSWGEVLKAVETGQIGAAYRDEFEVKSVLRSDPTLSLSMRTVTFDDLEDTLGIAVGIQDRVLLAFINQLLAQSTEKLTIDSVLKAMDK